MTLDRSFAELNRIATERLRKLVARLADKDLQHPRFEGWTVAVTLAHLGFWDRRILYALDQTARERTLVTPIVDPFVNDIVLSLFAAIPPAGAARLAVETAQELDKRLESFPEEWVEQLQAYNQRWVIRALHRGEHMDDIQSALTA